MSSSSIIFVLWMLRLLTGGLDSVDGTRTPTTTPTLKSYTSTTTLGEELPSSGACVDPNGKPMRCPWEAADGGE
jgi:hypothetical protein